MLRTLSYFVTKLLVCERTEAPQNLLPDTPVYVAISGRFPPYQTIRFQELNESAIVSGHLPSERLDGVRETYTFYVAIGDAAPPCQRSFSRDAYQLSAVNEVQMATSIR